MPPFRLALVGAGRMGRQHVAALAGSRRVEIVAVADPAGAAGLDVPCHATLDALLAAGGFDAALVAAPTRLHRTVICRLAEAGVPVLAEKPCGRTADDARAIAAAAHAIPLRVGYWRRHIPALADLQAEIAGGALGEIQLVLCLHWDELPPPAAFRDPGSSGGILVDVAVHEFDLMRYLTGSPVAAAAGFEGGVRYDEPVAGDPENVAVAVRLATGGIGIASCGRRHPHGDHQRVEVVGTRDARVVPFGVGAEGLATIAAALRAQAEDFARLVRGGTSRGATVDDAIAALEAAALAAGALVSAP